MRCLLCWSALSCLQKLSILFLNIQIYVYLGWLSAYQLNQQSCWFKPASDLAHKSILLQIWKERPPIINSLFADTNWIITAAFIIQISPCCEKKITIGNPCFCICDIEIYKKSNLGKRLIHTRLDIRINSSGLHPVAML